MIDSSRPSTPHEMSTTTEELEATLESEKALLRDTITELGDRAQTAVDWRHHYREHTGLLLGAAVVVGIAAGVGSARTPRRLRSQAMSAVASVPRAASSTVAPAVRSSLNSLTAMILGRLLGAAEDAVRGWARNKFEGRGTRRRGAADVRPPEPDVLH